MEELEILLEAEKNSEILISLEPEQEKIIPFIGENGNWFINGVDTGKPSRGENGSNGIYIGEDEPTDENIDIWLDTNGVSEPTTMIVENNTLIVKPTITTKVEGGMLIL